MDPRLQRLQLHKTGLNQPPSRQIPGFDGAGEASGAQLATAVSRSAATALSVPSNIDRHLLPQRQIAEFPAAAVTASRQSSLSESLHLSSSISIRADNQPLSAPLPSTTVPNINTGAGITPISAQHTSQIIHPGLSKPCLNQTAA